MFMSTLITGVTHFLSSYSNAEKEIKKVQLIEAVSETESR